MADGAGRGLGRVRATALLDALHAAQNEFYGGGSDTELRRLIPPDVVWTVPGASPIAGTYAGSTRSSRTSCGGATSPPGRSVCTAETS